MPFPSSVTVSGRTDNTRTSQSARGSSLFLTTFTSPLSEVDAVADREGWLAKIVSPGINIVETLTNMIDSRLYRYCIAELLSFYHTRTV